MVLFIIYEDTKNTFKMSSWLGEVAHQVANGFKFVTAKTEQGSELEIP